MMGDVYPDSARSFLGPMRPAWGDLQRLQALREMERALLRSISALEVQPDTAKIRKEIELTRQHLTAVRHEMSQLERLLALL